MAFIAWNLKIVRNKLEKRAWRERGRKKEEKREESKGGRERKKKRELEREGGREIMID